MGQRGKGSERYKVQLENKLVTGMGVQSHHCNSLVGGQVITTLTVVSTASCIELWNPCVVHLKLTGHCWSTPSIDQSIDQEIGLNHRALRRRKPAPSK